MKKRRIYRLAFYSFYDAQGIAAHLERMAARGWMIDSISGALWRYRAIEPSQLHFSVTYFPKASSFDPGPTEGQQVFADYCAQVGWEPAVRWGQMQIFYTDQSDPIPLETDPVTQVENIRAAMRRSFLPGMLATLALAIFQLVFFFWRMYTGPLDALSSPITLLSSAIWLPIALMALLELGFYARWLPRARQAAREGRMLHIRTWRYASFAFVSILFVVEILFLLTTSRRELIYFLFGVVLVVLVCVLTAAATRALRGLGASRRVNRAVSIGICVAVTLAGMSALVAGVISLSRRGLLGSSDPVDSYTVYGITWEVYADPIPLRVESLTGAAEDDRYSTEAHIQSSPLLTQADYRQDLRLDCDEELPDLSYTVVDVKLPLLYGLCRGYLLEQYARRSPEVPPEYMDHAVLQDWAPDGVTALYRHYTGDEPRNRYVFCLEGRLAEVHYWSDDPTQAQLELTAAALCPEALELP